MISANFYESLFLEMGVFTCQEIIKNVEKRYQGDRLDTCFPVNMDSDFLIANACFRKKQIQTT